MEQLRARLGGLIERSDLGADAGELANEALEELAVAIEELQARNDELARSRSALEERLLRDRRHDLVTDALRSSEERLRSLFESADVGIVLCDTRGSIVFINGEASTTLDRHRHDLDGDTWLSSVHPDDRHDVDAAIATACERRRSTGLRHRIVHRDGAVVWVDHSVAPFIEGDDVTGFVSTIVDVTVEHTAMAELAASRDFTEALLDTAGVLVVVVDGSGTVLRFNRAAEAVSGFAASEIVGRNFATSLLPPDQRVRTLAVLDELSASASDRISGAFDNEWLTAAGGRPRISWTYTSVTSGDGGTVIIGTGIDITERLALESRLAQADRLESIGRLTAGVAHDFNNTLTTLRLRIDRMGARDLDAHTLSDLDAMTATIERTQQLITDLHTFSRRGPSEPESVVIASEVRRIVDVFSDLLGERVTVDLDLAADGATVEIDPGRLERALTNLVFNGRDAMPDGGTLRISTHVETVGASPTTDARIPPRIDPGSYVVLAIGDTGVGIEPDDLPHVFDPYYTTKPPGRGTGLGLATTYGTVAQIGGGITVDSTPGKGSTFNVWLPLAALPERPTAPPTRRDRRGTVLVVDDDDDLREVLVGELASIGYRTLEAASASEAFTHLGEPVDVLVCDVQLPDLDGGAVAARFGERDRDLGVVFVSGATPSRVRALLPADACVLTKPFALDDLVAAFSAPQEHRVP